MDSELGQILIVASGMFSIILLGLLMLWAVRWSRRTNEDLKKANKDSQVKMMIEASEQNNYGKLFPNYLAGSVSKGESLLGKMLAIVAMAAFSSFLIYAAYIGYQLI